MLCADESPFSHLQLLQVVSFFHLLRWPSPGRMLNAYEKLWRLNQAGSIWTLTLSPLPHTKRDSANGQPEKEQWGWEGLSSRRVQKSALMTLWSVSEEASVRLVENFFEKLKEGKNKSEALGQRGKRSERRKTSIIRSSGQRLFWWGRRIRYIAGMPTIRSEIGAEPMEWPPAFHLS